MARVRRAPVEAVEGVPAELADPLAPIWSDPEALAAHPALGRYVDAGMWQRLAIGGRVFHTVAARWARDHGLTTGRWGGEAVDWRRFREAVEPGGR